MGVGAMKITTHFWTSLIFTIKTCYTSIRDHPFVSVTLFILYILHTFLPSVFGFLVTSSPILVCTAVLLGALLNLGHLQKKTEVVQHKRKITSRKAEVVENGVPIEKDNSISMETLVGGKNRDLNMKVVDREKKKKKVDLSPIIGNGLIDRTVVIEEQAKERHSHSEKQPIQEDKESNDSGLVKKKTEIPKEEKQIGENMIDQSSSISKKKKKNKGLELKTEKKPVSGSSHLNDWVHGSSSNHNHNHNRIEDNAAESSDCGSDQAQCSSPLASMAEIIPVLDELHPLLDFLTPQSAVATVDESDIASEWSDRSIDGSVDSEDDEEEEGENREVEEAHESEEEGIKSVVTWTEDDEKNLKDLGTLELERNQRLETLIAKRRARKTLSMDVEINLIDLEIDEPQSQIPPIVTTRNNNPFDLPFYSTKSGEIQPVPASAPSVLLPRRNPFDLPFEPPIEERSNLNVNADNVQQVFLPPVPEKDMYFCRHQSFSWGHSFPPNHVEKDKHVIDSRPLLGSMESEGNGYRPALQRQMTQKTEPKLTCVPEHESSSSVADEEDEDHQNINDEQEEQVPQQESEASEDVELVEMDHEEVVSISSSSSEVNENILHENTNVVESKNLQPINSGESTEGTSNFLQQSPLPPIEIEVKSIVMEHAEDIPIEEPVYDSSPSASETMTFEDASDSYLATSEGGTPRVSSKEKSLLSSNGSIKNETRPREIPEVTEVGLPETSEKQDHVNAAIKIPETPSEVQKVEVKEELHPVTSSSSSASEKTILSVEKSTVQPFANGDHQELQEFSTPRAIPTNIN